MYAILTALGPLLHDPLAPFAVEVLFPDPVVSHGEALVEKRRGLPPEHRFDQRVVAVAPRHALRRTDVVFPREGDAGNLFDLADQLVDRHQLIRPEIDRRRDEMIAMHDHVDPLDTIVDIHEAPRLISSTPDADRTAAG